MKTFVAIILIAFTIAMTSCNKKGCHKPDDKEKHECSHSDDSTSPSVR